MGSRREGKFTDAGTFLHDPVVLKSLFSNVLLYTKVDPLELQTHARCKFF